MNYLKHIDGLRAVAIISVILFHLNLEYFKGGFIRAKIISGESIKEFYSQKRLDKENFDQQVIDALNSEKEYIINPNNYYYNHKRWPWSYINTEYMDEYGKFDPETKETWKDIITNL